MRPRNEPRSPRKRGETGSTSASERDRTGERSRPPTSGAGGPVRRSAGERRGTRWAELFALAFPTAAVAGFGALAGARIRALASATRGVRPEGPPIAAGTPVDPAVIRAASAPLSEWSIVAVAVPVFFGCWAVALGGAHLVARLLAGRRVAGR